MNTIEFVRHVSKDKFEPHGVGIEAPVSVEASEPIKDYVVKKVKKENLMNRNVIIVASPVNRSLETAVLIIEQLGKYKIKPEFNQTEQISSYGFDENGNVINLRDLKMSEKWAEGKEIAKRKGESDQAENYSLESWCKIGMNKRIGNGLTHLEVASRLAGFLMQNIKGKDNYINAISHSGDIEFPLYALLQKIEHSRFDAVKPLAYFQSTGGALTPWKV